MVPVPDTFYFSYFCVRLPFAYCAFGVRSLCMRRSLSIRPLLTVLGSPLCSHRGVFIVLPFCPQQPFIVRSPLRFNSSPLSFITPTWNTHVKIQACLLNNDKKFISNRMDFVLFKIA